MTINDLLKEYKTCYRLANELGFHNNTVYRWKKDGFIPANTQKKIELLTQGKFKSDDKK
jgi:hypothetical protein